MGLLHVLNLEGIACLLILHLVDGVRALAATSHEAPNLLAFEPQLDPDIVGLLAHVVGEPSRLRGWEGLAGARRVGDERGKDTGSGRRHGDFVVWARRSLSGGEVGGASGRAGFVCGRVYPCTSGLGACEACGAVAAFAPRGSRE